MGEDLVAQLCYAGLSLLGLGLAGGFGIPFFTSPRIGLSAHLAAIEGGLALIAIGLLGERLEIGATATAIIAPTLWLSFYVLWIGLLLGAAWGTGRALPIAGAGHTAKPWQENVARLLIVGGSIGALAGVGALLVLWHWRPL